MMTVKKCQSYKCECKKIWVEKARIKTVSNKCEFKKKSKMKKDENRKWEV